MSTAPPRVHKTNDNAATPSCRRGRRMTGMARRSLLTPLLYERLAPELCFDLRIVLPEDDFLLLAFFLGLDEGVVVVVFRFPPAIWMIC